jgi:hypothetical protein
MSANYEWQKQQSKHRVDTRMREAMVERQLSSLPKRPGLWARLMTALANRRPAPRQARASLRRSESQP